MRHDVVENGIWMKAMDIGVIMRGRHSSVSIELRDSRETRTDPADCLPFMRSKSANSLSHAVSTRPSQHTTDLHVQSPSRFSQIAHLLQQHSHLALHPISTLFNLANAYASLTERALEKSSRYPARLNPTCSLAAD